MTLRGHHEARDLEALVIEWRNAMLAIDRLSVQHRQRDIAPLERMVAAHNALVQYIDETLL